MRFAVGDSIAISVWDKEIGEDDELVGQATLHLHDVFAIEPPVDGTVKGLWVQLQRPASEQVALMILHSLPLCVALDCCGKSG
jgi:hypothetical protein